jgi:hypothetical protein
MQKLTVVVLISASCLLARSEGRSCYDVGGAIATNFIDGTNTLGTATGDLAGGLGVSVLGAPAPGPDNTLVFHVHHHWVLATGETISFNDAYVTFYPTAAPGLYGASYIDGVKVNGGGSGRYARASGTLSVFGAVVYNPAEVTKSQITLRYAGKVCLAESSLTE